MTMTDAAAAERAKAVAQADAAEAAVLRAARLVDQAAALVVLRGQDGWLGPARDAFDARGLRLHDRLAGEEHDLRLLALAIRGSV
ncbi:hypothetical protein [Agrococcus citreus]|uniref:Acyl-CoA dehydrogenase n=1 Tax=Agrococcus citreus TaxID=84643 RepID=A0ABN1YV26_9MICO